MNPNEFQVALDARISQHDLLTHPFYKAWSAGKLSVEHLRAYAREYFHHVAAYPTFLSAFHSRLADGSLRRAVLRNLADEEVEGRTHSDMWLDFAEGVGLSSDEVRRSQPSAAVRLLIERFHRNASKDSSVEVLAALYAYESQVPRISSEKARSLLSHYGTDAHTCGYFVLHSYADVIHSQIWRDELLRLVGRNPKLSDGALNSAGRAACWLWQALDGSEAHQLSEQSFSVA